MTAAAFLILLIACVNFMNLSTARSTERSKEIGIRKSLGAFKKQIGVQFLGESLLISFIAMVIAGVLAEVFLPLFNYVTDKNLDIQYFKQPLLTGILVGCTLFSGMVAGLYPSIFLSSLDPVVSLKGFSRIKPKGATIRKTLIVFQFVMSMALLTGSLIVYNQLQFIQNKDLGFKSESVVVVPFKNYRLIRNFEAIRNELKKIPAVKSVSAASNLPGKQFNQNSIYRPSDPLNSISASEAAVDYDFFEALDITFQEGRGFSKDYPSDSLSFIINQTAVNNLHLEEPLGKEIVWDWDDGQPPMKGTIIGVVKDFNYNSLHQPIRPLLFYLSPRYNDVVIKLETNDLNTTMASVELVWRLFEERFGFEYTILSSIILLQYNTEELTGNVFSGFSLISITIACFGLFAIASISFSHRAKEVGIRKVMGASIIKILGILTKDFIKLIALAIVIATPLAWVIMNSWLEDFTYRIDISFSNFLISALVLIVIALFTISYLTIKTAYSNPIDTLKEE